MKEKKNTDLELSDELDDKKSFVVSISQRSEQLRQYWHMTKIISSTVWTAELCHHPIHIWDSSGRVKELKQLTFNASISVMASRNRGSLIKAIAILSSASPGVAAIMLSSFSPRTMAPIWLRWNLGYTIADCRAKMSWLSRFVSTGGTWGLGFSGARTGGLTTWTVADGSRPSSTHPW